VLLFQAVTSLSFRFLVVMPFAGFSGITFGESPEKALKVMSNIKKHISARQQWAYLQPVVYYCT
jgi:hypothetical protein